MSDHAYSPTCGCPGCQFMWAAQETLRRCGGPLKIGQFTPVNGGIAEDPRYPGLYRTWTGEYWHPQFLLNEPVCICKENGRSHQFGCLIDDSDLPVNAPVDQGEAMRMRNGK